jgi:CheY-like chemotaxis protein
MDGLEMLRHIKTKQDESPFAVIVAANKAADYQCELANAYIVKPFATDELVKAVLNLMKQYDDTLLCETCHQKTDCDNSALPLQTVSRMIKAIDLGISQSLFYDLFEDEIVTFGLKVDSLMQEVHQLRHECPSVTVD